jgi:hypothetical protein
MHASSACRTRRQRRLRTADALVAAIATVAAVGGALSGVHPTGTPMVDPVYGAMVAAGITLLASRASREAALVVAGLAFGLSRGALLMPAAVGLVLAFSQVWVKRWHRQISALVGAVDAQVLLRLPHMGFFGLTAALGVAATAVLSVSAIRSVGPTGRQRLIWAGAGLFGLTILLGAPAVIGAMLARGPAVEGISHIRAAMSLLNDGRSVDSTPQLRLAASEFAATHNDMGSWWSAGALFLPVVSQQRRALEKAAGVVQRVTATAARRAPSLDYNSLRLQGGVIDLARIAAMGPAVDDLDRSLTAASATLGGLNTTWVAGPVRDRLRDLDTQLAKAKRNSDLAADFIRAAPGLLGGEGPRHYFVAFVTPAESRGLAGYMGAYGILTAVNGKITLTESGATTDLPTTRGHFNTGLPGSSQITGPPDFLTRYGMFLRDDYFGDLTFAPDLPTVNQVIGEAYAQLGGQTIDGTLVIDPRAVAALLELTGPVRIHGLPELLTSENANDVLLRQQYEVLETATDNSTSRHDYLQDALQATFPQLLSRSLPGPRTLADDLGPVVSSGDLEFWSSHPGDQPLISGLGISGDFPNRDGGDLLSVETSNSANNKADAYLYRSIDDRVTYDPGSGEVTAHLTITLRNTAPPSGLPHYVIGSFGGSNLPLGTNVTWLTVYSPLGITEDPASRTDIRPVAEPEFGVNAYSAFVTIPSNTTVTVSMTLVGRIHPGPRYSLTVRHQPSANPDHDTVEVTASSGPGARNEFKWTLTDAEVQTRTVLFPR